MRLLWICWRPRTRQDNKSTTNRNSGVLSHMPASSRCLLYWCLNTSSIRPSVVAFNLILQCMSEKLYIRVVYYWPYSTYGPVTDAQSTAAPQSWIASDLFVGLWSLACSPAEIPRKHFPRDILARMSARNKSCVSGRWNLENDTTRGQTGSTTPQQTADRPIRYKRVVSWTVRTPDMLATSS